MGNPRGALSLQWGLDRCPDTSRLVTYRQSYAPRTFHADTKRLEIRPSNLIEDVCDVAPGREPVSSNYGDYTVRQRVSKRGWGVRGRRAQQWAHWTAYC